MLLQAVHLPPAVRPFQTHDGLYDRLVQPDVHSTGAIHA